MEVRNSKNGQAINKNQANPNRYSHGSNNNKKYSFKQMMPLYIGQAMLNVNGRDSSQRYNKEEA
jgi:hypothetical protein